MLRPLTGLAAVLLVALCGPGSSAGPQEPFPPPPRAAGAPKVLLVTGGHDHDISFYSVLDRDDLDVRVDPYPSGLRAGPREPGPDTEAIVLYDMPPTMTPEQKDTLHSWVEHGGGLVVLHHAIAGRTGWRWWHEEVVGARYVEEGEGESPSSYRHDEVVRVSVVARHPVTAGIEPFVILDETYKDLWISPRIEVLLRTDNRTSDGPVAWIFPHPKARVAVIQLGHGRDAHLHPQFRRLVHNAVLWAAGRSVPD